jgi:hypothetical protein
VPARQHDAWDLGVTTTDDFSNAEVLYDEVGKLYSWMREVPHNNAFLDLELHTSFLVQISR